VAPAPAGDETVTQFSAASGSGGPAPFVVTRSRAGLEEHRAVRSTRPTVRPDSKDGATTIVFHSARRAVIRVTVVRVHPTCERVGAFDVRAHKGMNRIKWRGRLHGRALQEGTYRLRVRPLGPGRSKAAVLKLVVVRGTPLSVRQLRDARNANVCGAISNDDRNAPGPALGGTATPNGGASGSQAAGRDLGAESRPTGAAGRIERGAKALGARFRKAVDDKGPAEPLVWAALALSMLLLALAAVPSETLSGARAGPIAHKRFEIALAGTGALAAAFLIVLLS
jgi:hypothetical protein